LQFKKYSSNHGKKNTFLLVFYIKYGFIYCHAAANGCWYFFIENEYNTDTALIISLIFEHSKGYHYIKKKKMGNSIAAFVFILF
jgi:hypothetical protein